jgi:hypothetical protein
MAVVVLDIEVQDAKKLPTPSDQEMVPALPAHGADPALGDGVSVRGLDRRADDLSAEPVPEVVEGSGELAVTVADQEPDGGGLLSRAVTCPLTLRNDFWHPMGISSALSPSVWLAAVGVPAGRRLPE